MMNDLSPFSEYPERHERHERHEGLTETWRELEATPAEIAEWTPLAWQLTRWPERHITPADTQRLLAALAPAMPAVSPVRQAVRAHQRLHPLRRLADMARIQASILQPAFWLASVIIVLLGVTVEVSTTSTTDTSTALLLQAIGPLLACLSIASAFRSTSARMLEFELGCPPSVLQLIVTRLVVVLGYDTALGLGLSAVSTLAGGSNFVTLTLHWLMPLLLVAGMAFILSLWLPTAYASGIAYGIWLAALAMYYATALLPYRLPFTGVPVAYEYAIGIIGLALLIAGTMAFPERLPRLLPKS